MAVMNPYLNFSGNTEEAFNFYKSIFGGEFKMLMRFGDTPEKDRLPVELQDKIMHIALPIGTSMLMATDALKEMGQKLSVGNNHHISYSADSEADGQRIFDALAVGGKVGVLYTKQFWGDTLGMLTDQYGIQWMIGYNDMQNQ